MFLALPIGDGMAWRVNRLFGVAGTVSRRAPQRRGRDNSVHVRLMWIGFDVIRDSLVFLTPHGSLGLGSESAMA